MDKRDPEGGSMSEKMLVPDQVHSRNTRLFDLIAKVLEVKPRRYNQGTWGEFLPTEEQEDEARIQFDESLDNSDARWRKIKSAKECETSLCVAGHAAALSGYNPILTCAGDLDWGQVSRKLDVSHDEGEPVAQVAAKLLGLTEEEADRLFEASNETTPELLRAYGRGKEIIG